MSTIPFIDLFCGAGGLSTGFEQAGFSSVFGNDNNKDAIKTYAHNHPSSSIFPEGVQELHGDLIRARTGLDKIPLVVGGPNCQGVSLRGKRDPGDPKNDMFFHFQRIIGELKPDWFVMENVPGLLHRHNRGLLADIFKAFQDIGYSVGGEVLLAADYGVPQLRYRFILIGNNCGKTIRFPNPTHRAPVEHFSKQVQMYDHDVRPTWLSVKEGIGDLPPIENGGGAEISTYGQRKRCTDYQKMCRKDAKKLFNHLAHKTSERNISFIKHIPPGGNWKDIPEDIRPERFKKVALKDHTTTYGRLRWDSPARTVTTYFNNISSGAFTHPEQDRGISVREGARIQGFPDKFRFLGSVARQYRQVGNAVPPIMALHVARLISMMMNDEEIHDVSHPATVTYSSQSHSIVIERPLKGMRFNLDKHLVRS